MGDIAIIAPALAPPPAVAPVHPSQIVPARTDKAGRATCGEPTGG